MSKFKTTIIVEPELKENLEKLQSEMKRLNFIQLDHKKNSTDSNQGYLEFLRNAPTLQEIIDSVLHVVKSLGGKYSFTVVREKSI